MQGKGSECLECLFVCLFKSIELPDVQTTLCWATMGYVELFRVHIQCGVKAIECLECARPDRIYSRSDFLGQFHEFFYKTTNVLLLPLPGWIDCSAGIDKTLHRDCVETPERWRLNLGVSFSILLVKLLRNQMVQLRCCQHPVSHRLLHLGND